MLLEGQRDKELLDLANHKISLMSTKETLLDNKFNVANITLKVEQENNTTLRNENAKLTKRYNTLKGITLATSTLSLILILKLLL